VKVYEAIADAVAHKGTDTVFGLLGQANMHMIHSLVHDHGVRYIRTATENGAVLMAYGYGARSGRIGVACVTRGPGLTNTVTALTEAARRRTPMLLLVGDTAEGDRWSRQDIDQGELVRATGAGFQRVRSAETAGQDIDAALARTTRERRPIVLSAPLNVQVSEVEYRPAEGAEPGAAVIDAGELDAAVGIIASANRPVVVAGRGAVRAGARSALLGLAGRIGAPVATTLGAKDLFRGERADVGICGSVASPLGGDVLARADCLVFFGASLNYDTTAKGAYTDEKRVVQVDDDSAAIGAKTRVTAGVVGDARLVAEQMVDWLDAAGSASPPWWDARPTDGPSESTRREDGVLDGPGFTAHLDRLLPSRRTVVCDVGGFMVAPMTLLSVPEPDAMVLATAFGSIGLGLSTGIGAAFARPEQPVVVAAGDGGTMESMIELWTATRYRLDVILVIYNNRSYAAEIRVAEHAGLDPDLASSDWPDFVPLAEALGATGVAVRGIADLDRLALAIASDARPLVVDVQLG
jgi:thiamine pyrophosphate-dependent acetolactate synthase large subunit-like protein